MVLPVVVALAGATAMAAGSGSARPTTTMPIRISRDIKAPTPEELEALKRKAIEMIKRARKQGLLPPEPGPMERALEQMMQLQTAGLATRPAEEPAGPPAPARLRRAVGPTSRPAAGRTYRPIRRPAVTSRPAARPRWTWRTVTSRPAAASRPAASQPAARLARRGPTTAPARPAVSYYPHVTGPAPGRRPSYRSPTQRELSRKAAALYRNWSRGITRVDRTGGEPAQPHPTSQPASQPAAQPAQPAGEPAARPAQPTTKPFKLPPEKRTYMFSWSDRSVRDAVWDFARMSGLTVIGLERATGAPITYQSPKEMTYDHALSVFNDLLAERNLFLLRTEDYLLLLRLPDIVRFLRPDHIYPNVEQFRKANLSDNDAALLFYAPPKGSAADIVERYRTFLPDYVRMSAVPQSNRLQIIAKVKDIRKFLDIMDKVAPLPSEPEKPFEFIEIRHMKAQEMESLLRRLPVSYTHLTLPTN